MTQKIKGHKYSLQVVDILNAYRTRNEKYLHKITFKEPDGSIFIAEEYEADVQSRFHMHKVCTFTLTQTGLNGNLDWVRFEGVAAQPEEAITTVTRDHLILAQTSFNAAVQLGLRNRWTNDRIMSEACNFASGIKTLAKQIAENFV